MAQPSYIPSQQAKLVTWCTNFNTLILASPTTYGLLPADATTINSYVTAFLSAYAISSKTSPGTRTPASIQNTNNTQAAMLGIVRPYAIQIRNNQGVSDANKLALGLTVPSSSRTPIPCPATPPAISITAAQPLVFTMTINDPTAPASKRKKAVGARAWVMYAVFGTAPATDMTGAVQIAAGTKTPFPITFVSGNVGKYATLWAAWQGRNVSQPGGLMLSPFSTPVSMIVPA